LSLDIPSRVIEKKRQGEEISPEELKSFFEGYLSSEVPDYQVSAFLMAVHFQGMAATELECLLDLMIGSGAVLDLSFLSCPRVDKHSTGGVGDKTSIVIAPLAAELGLCVPMMSGRGLGHTAGTLDKLEAIPGFRTDLTLDEFRSVLGTTGVAMMGQTEEIAPLDRRLYALRDATATVPSIPLIATSILSKKLAEDLEGLVLDVKTGAGAFLPETGASLDLARTMVSLAESRGVRTAALVTAMDRPLGRAVGNGLETQEAFRCLAGEGPEDLAQLCSALVGEMLLVGRRVEDVQEGTALARDALSAGAAMDRMARLVELQGGDPRTVEEPDRIASAPHTTTVAAEESGFVHTIHPVALGYGVTALGGGRRRMAEAIDLRVGFRLHVSVGDWVERGDPLGQVHAASEADLGRGRAILDDAIRFEPDPPSKPLPLFVDRIAAAS